MHVCIVCICIHLPCGLTAEAIIHAGCAPPCVGEFDQAVNREADAAGWAMLAAALKAVCRETRGARLAQTL